MRRKLSAKHCLVLGVWGEEDRALPGAAAPQSGRRIGAVPSCIPESGVTSAVRQLHSSLPPPPPRH